MKNKIMLIAAGDSLVVGRNPLIDLIKNDAILFDNAKSYLGSLEPFITDKSITLILSVSMHIQF